jgi:Ty3 transposon capsid-like protein
MEYGPHFEDAHCAVLSRMRQLMGDAMVEDMLARAGNPDDQIAMVEAFANLGTKDLSNDPMIQLASSNARLADEMHRQSNVMQTNFAAMHQHSQSMRGRPKAIALGVPKYEGKDSENLLRWLLKVSIAADAQLIDNEQLKIAFAMSYMSGRAEDWVYTQKMMDPQCFPTWEIFVNKLRGVFMPPNSDFRYRAKLLSLKQGSRSLEAYVQEIRFLVACLSDDDKLPESTLVTVFMQGLKTSPAKTQLFRIYPATLEDAIRIALSEDYSHRQARSSGYESSQDMDLSAIESRDLAKIRCYGCNLPGHLRRNCPQGRGTNARFNNRRGGAVRSDSRQAREPTAARRVRFQGNEHSQ